ncbi:MAG TPA: GxxExxY protein [Candidatus Sulfomarinibacteraceae bacterium]|nr:GxxExxY protein [Candidatus Sulfomarinibacteraceae bacterium]
MCGSLRCRSIIRGSRARGRAGTRRVDFFVEERVMVELKAVIGLENAHLAQAINYLEAYGLDVGLLINFGSPSLQFKRVMKPGR